jgi:hypothetical protein
MPGRAAFTRRLLRAWSYGVAAGMSNYWRTIGLAAFKPVLLSSFPMILGGSYEGVGALVRHGLPVIEAIGVDAQQELDAVPGPLGDLGGGHSGVEPQ